MMDKIVCAFVGHDWKRWSYNRITRHATRRCKRCGKCEDKPLPPLKLAA